MDAKDVITFCQNDFQHTSFIIFDDMRKRGDLCDLTIKVKSESFAAHRVVLAAGIPYFQSMFMGSGVETEEKEIAVEDLDPKALESLIQYAYTGKIEISTENVYPLLLASQFLKVNHIPDACAQFLSERLEIDNVVEVRAFGFEVNNSNLIENCDDYIRRNFEEFSKTDDLLTLSHSCLKKIISEDDLNVSSEEIAYEAVMKWIKSSPSERCVLLAELLSEVRLIFLPTDYLMEQVESDDLIRSSVPCRDLVSDVKYYHLLPKRRSAFSNLKSRPRKNHLNHNLYALSACACSLSFHQFDLNNETWCNLATARLKDVKVYHVLAVNGEIYMFLKETIVTFCPKTGKWKVLESKHGCIEGAAVVSHENKIYCFGSRETQYSSNVLCFDTQMKNWLTEGETKTGKWNHAAVFLGESIYITGGLIDTNKFNYRVGHLPMFPYPLNNAEKYDPSTGSCTDIASMLTPRDRHGCTTFNCKIYVCGGMSTCERVYKDAVTLNNSEMYDPLTNQWNFISSMKNSTYLRSLVSYNGKIYALQESKGEIYDPKSDNWKSDFPVLGGFTAAVSISVSNFKNDST